MKTKDDSNATKKHSDSVDEKKKVDDKKKQASKASESSRGTKSTAGNNVGKTASARGKKDEIHQKPAAAEVAAVSPVLQTASQSDDNIAATFVSAAAVDSNVEPELSASLLVDPSLIHFAPVDPSAFDNTAEGEPVPSESDYTSLDLNPQSVHVDISDDEPATFDTSSHEMKSFGHSESAPLKADRYRTSDDLTELAVDVKEVENVQSSIAVMHTIDPCSGETDNVESNAALSHDLGSTEIDDIDPNSAKVDKINSGLAEVDDIDPSSAEVDNIEVNENPCVAEVDKSSVLSDHLESQIDHLGTSDVVAGDLHESGTEHNDEDDSDLPTVNLHSDIPCTNYSAQILTRSIRHNLTKIVITMMNLQMWKTSVKGTSR